MNLFLFAGGQGGQGGGLMAYLPFILILAIMYFLMIRPQAKRQKEKQRMLEALKKGDAYFAKRKFKEAEALMPQSKWAAKASLMAAYADYSRNSYNSSVFGLERHIQNYPADKNIPYAHFLIAICYYEQILSLIHI